MDSASIIQALEQEWEQQTGFPARLRVGEFDEAGLERLLSLLSTIEQEGNVPLSWRMVALLWFIPLFMTWQRERLVEQGEDPYTFEEAFHRVLNKLENILGLP
ncbi:MAG TPA: hypothetical protein DEF43_14285 [Chloroflexus aurantiacus]|jgi:hypothetical protein|uniref:Uncharacterized protein n=1 Tax=Chloroflexus aurantiacus (strain ATCC 29366 / DSM 635 / J-10-fl) TaxID=324602 RepID=A9WB58_CHLAA|nr:MULTISPECIES: hypothetical protein [Chloroflexus]ABY36851.1 hypothetical protein Caur_3668 [Chloroflexus aurantiacus J-10-fl]RMG48353.1 MAG: hypothetical protein D6716_13395 [Chloroflexota bacterium]HBW68301.1 hypothetical protein [Chloroflexus aurantiacus]